MSRMTLRNLTLLSAAAVSLAACGSGEAKENEKAAAPAEQAAVLGPNDVATAEVASLGGGVTLTGTLEPFQVVEVKAQAPGVATGISVDRGSRVGQGQVLARIQAEGIRSQAAGAASGVAAAEAGVALARRQFESAKSLYDAGAMAELDYRAAQTQLQAAQAQLAAARAQSAGASEAAARTAVRAPITGQVSAKSVSEGEAVNVGQTLFTVVDSRSLELRGQVPVDQAAQVRAGLPVEFSLDAYPGRTFSGTISRVDPVADPATRQVGVTMRLPNAGGELIGGLFAAGKVLTGGSRQAVLVPQAAVRGQGDASYVWIVQDGRAVRRAVRAGERDEARRMVAIEQGLAGGERVIVSPGEVREGAAVRLAETPAEATAAPAAGQEK